MKQKLLSPKLRRGGIRPALDFVFDLPSELRQLATNLRAQPARKKTVTLQQVGNLKLLPIAPGNFCMGGASEAVAGNPLTQVTLTKPFWLGATAVTQLQWDAVMGCNASFYRGANLPVAQVNHTEALAFCWKVTERERAAGRLPEGYWFTLPTEAQWEYACRAGTNGDYAADLNAMAWFEVNSGGEPHEVGIKQANPWGLYDMLGNVWEWCQDWYGPYRGGNVTDPTGAPAGTQRVYRGGSSYLSVDYCQTGFRGRNSPGTRINGVGFRLALSSIR